MPRNLVFAANLRFFPGVPWAVPLTAVYLWFFWRYLKGAGPPEETRELRRTSLRANRVTGAGWAWSLLAGTGFWNLSVSSFSRFGWLQSVGGKLSEQNSFRTRRMCQNCTVVSLALHGRAGLLASSRKEVALCGYMQAPIERRSGTGNTRS